MATVNAGLPNRRIFLDAWLHYRLNHQKQHLIQLVMPTSVFVAFIQTVRTHHLIV